MMKRSSTLIGAILSALPLLNGCTVKTPGAPVWTIEATVPFEKRVYKMGEMIADSAKYAEQGWGIKVNAVDSTLLFQQDAELNSQAIDTLITYEASPPGLFTNRIGLITVEQPSPDTNTVVIDQVNPNVHPGDQLPIPAFNFAQTHGTLRFNVFNWVQVRNGYLILTVTNQFPFDIDTLTIGMTSIDPNGPPEYLGAINFFAPTGRIPRNGGQVTDSLSLGGKMLHNVIEMTADGHSPGTMPERITVTADQKMFLKLTVSQTSVDSANAEIGQQDFSSPSTLPINNRNKIIDAKIMRGAAVFRLTNVTPFRLTSHMRFANIIDTAGLPLTATVNLDPFQAGNVTNLDLTGATIQMGLADQRLRVENAVTVEDTRITRYNGQTYQTIASSGGVDVEYYTTDLILESFRGVLDSIKVDIPASTQTVEMPEGLDSLSFTTDSGFVFVHNPVNLRLLVGLDVTALNTVTGRTETLTLRDTIRPGPAMDTLILRHADRLLSVVPNQLSYHGWVGMGTVFFGSAREGSVSSTDSLSGHIRVRSGLKFTVGTTEIRTPFDQQDEALDYPIQGVQMHVDLANSIPLGGNVKLLVGNDTTRMDTLAIITIPRKLPLLNHRVTESSHQTLELGITSRQLEIFKRKPFFTRQILTIEANRDPGGPLSEGWIYPDDSLAVQASATVFYTVDPANGGN